MRENVKCTSLDLGCGNAKHKGFIGIDKLRTSDADIFADLNDGIPLLDNSVSKVIAYHVLDFVDNLDFMMSEIRRVCKDKATIDILVPNASSILAFEFRKHFFTRRAFDFTNGFKVIKRPSVLTSTFPTRWLFQILSFKLQVVKPFNSLTQQQEVSNGSTKGPSR